MIDLIKTLILMKNQYLTNGEQVFSDSYQLNQKVSASETLAPQLLNPMGLVEARGPISVSYTINVLQAVNILLNWS